LYLKQIALQNFRNYLSAAWEFDPRGNLIIGPNGCGKTNLLEAVAYCGVGKSIHFHRDDELLHYGADLFTIRSSFALDTQLTLSFQLAYQAGRKLLKLDEQPVRQLSRLFECVKVIYCAPEDMNLIGGSPRCRRQYFDLAISQLYPQYIPLLREYLHLVEQRNTLLKREYEPAEKRGWDLKFAHSLIEVLKFRRRYLELVNNSFSTEFSCISNQARDIRLNYLCYAPNGYSEDPERIMKHLSQLETREKRYQRSLIGAHLDDYEFILAGHELKTFGSQGQKRVAVIVLKLIQAALIETVTGIKPILLFDDIFAELDAEHTHRIRELVDYRYQVFIASPRSDISQVWTELERLPLPGVAS